MRKLVLVLAAAAALVVVSGAPASTLGDTAIGAGRTAACLIDSGSIPPCALPARSFSFFAFATPGGGAWGLYSHRTSLGAVIVAKVTCIEVEGNKAVIGGTSVTVGGETFGPWSVQMVDNGPSKDLLSPFLIDIDGLAKPCSSIASTSGYFPVESGGILVRDGALAGP